MHDVQLPEFGIGAGEGGVAPRVPVLGGDVEGKRVADQQAMDGLEDLVPVVHRQRAARQEIGLHVHYQQDRVLPVVLQVGLSTFHARTKRR